jgi:phage terminase large subunit-like protein
MIDDFHVHDYVRGVRSGKIVACHWVKAAVERHVSDLRNGHERGLYFDEAAGHRVLEFFSLLQHSKGKWAGTPIVLEPWEQFILWVVFGWKKSNGTRRFKTAYLEIARKNGKSTLAAGVGLYLLMADGEKGAEVFSAATKLDQAKITWIEAARMARKSPMLSKRVTIFGDKNPKASACSISLPGTASKFEPLGSDANTTDGLNVHAAIVDEIHAHRNGELWDVLETATGAREQPLIFGVTTAGFDRATLCFELNEHTQKILDGADVDDAFFGIIFTLDKDDDWQDETVWIKANPNLGVSKKIEDLREKSERAKQMPSRLNAFLRLELNIWTQSSVKWIPWDDWQQCGHAVEWDKLIGRRCYSGLDLSSTLDITAHVLVFPPEAEGDKYIVLPRFWIPEDNLRQRVHDDRVPYDAWLRAGWIMATPGNVVDYEWIFADIDDDAHDYDLQEVAFDRWGASRVVTVLQEKGLTMVEFGQGFASMSPPMKELERLIRTHELEHGNNPVLTWMADNLVARQDPAGNIKPDKDASREKIDGMVALIMALDRAMRHQGGGQSVYAKRGLIGV